MRTFLAIDIDEYTRDKLAAAAARIDAPGARITRVAPPNLHVTLKFLGEVGEADIADICKLVAEAAAQVEPFDIGIRGIQCIPPSGPSIRMLWGGVLDPTGRLKQLADGLSLALAGLGLKEEGRAFRGHITLARIRYLPQPQVIRDAAALLENEDFGTIGVTDVTVYTSDLTSDGPLYTPIDRAPLG